MVLQEEHGQEMIMQIFKLRGKKIFYCSLFFFQMSKPNERWCRILLEKKGTFLPPPCDRFFFFRQKKFFRIF